MLPGFGLVASRIGLEAAVARADFVLTREGSLDGQTLEGSFRDAFVFVVQDRWKRSQLIPGIDRLVCWRVGRSKPAADRSSKLNARRA